MSTQQRHGTSRKCHCFEDGVDLCAPGPERTKYIKDFMHPTLGMIDVFVTPEVYKAYWEGRNRELRQKADGMRCVVLNANRLPVRCRKDCSLCPAYGNKRPQVVSLDGPAQEVLCDESEDPATIATERERMEALASEIAAIKGERDRKILLRTLGNHTQTEIAEELGVTVSYVCKRMRILVERLRERLKGYR